MLDTAAKTKLGEGFPIFILATGQRCGSTLVQRFLCSNPAIMIWGEHDGVLNELFQMQEHLLGWEERFQTHLQRFTTRGPNQFIANMTPRSSSITEAAAEWIHAMWGKSARTLGRPFWGFKEVRYGFSVANQLLALFPRAKVVYLTRNVVDCLLSLIHWERSLGQWTRAHTEAALCRWASVNRSFQENLRGTDEWVFPIRYETILESPGVLTDDLVSWLGFEPASFDRGILEHKVYQDRYDGTDTRPKLTRADLSPEDWRLIERTGAADAAALLGYLIT